MSGWSRSQRSFSQQKTNLQLPVTLICWKRSSLIKFSDIQTKELSSLQMLYTTEGNNTVLLHLRVVCSHLLLPKGLALMRPHQAKWLPGSFWPGEGLLKGRPNPPLLRTKVREGTMRMSPTYRRPTPPPPPIMLKRCLLTHRQRTCTRLGPGT